MLITKEISKNGDPSEEPQLFADIKPNILCSRYWWFDAWEGHGMSFPFWRLYWNKNEGAYIFYKKKIKLRPGHIYLIPPYTPFSMGTEKNKQRHGPGYFFKCGRINSTVEELHHLEKGNILHFFTHFTLGFPYDNVVPGVYTIELQGQGRKEVEYVTSTLLSNHPHFSLEASLKVYHLIISAVSRLPKEIWSSKKLDSRVTIILEHMERNLHETMTNKQLAELINLSPSTFLRLFKSQVGLSPSKYLAQVRIDRASNLLLYTGKSIETIAEVCGFSDRYHFSKVFRKVKKVSPAAYRKRVGYY